MATGADGTERDELKIPVAGLGGSVSPVAGRLCNEVQIKHPRNTHFIVQNEFGLFFKGVSGCPGHFGPEL